MSEAQLSLVKRASAIECELEVLEGKLSQGELVDLDCFGRGASHLRRILESLGLERKPKDIGPTLGDLLREDQRLQREAAARAQEERRRMESAS
jgi:hypothetical protein